MPMSLEEFQTQYGALGRAMPEPGTAKKYGWMDRLGASVDSAQAGLLGVGEAAGLNWTDARRRNESAGDYVRAASIRDTGAPERITDIDGPTSLVKGIAGLAIDSAPQLATSLAAGVATGGLGLGLGVAGRLGVAAAAGAPFNTGDILRNQREEAGRTDLPSALALTIPYTAADMVGLDGMLATTRMARNSARGLDGMRGAPGYLARTGATALTTGGKEGLSEMSQEFVNQAGRIAVNPNQTFFNPEANERYLESFAGGALLGGAFGTIGGGRRTLAKPGASEDLLARPDFNLAGYGPADGPLETPANRERGVYNPLGDAVAPGLRGAGPGQYDLYNPDGTPTYGADTSFGYEPLPKFTTPQWDTSLGVAPGLQQQGLAFERGIATGGMTLRAPIDTGTGDMFSGESRVPQAQPQAPFELQPPDDMRNAGQRALDLQPPLPGTQAPQLPRGNQKGITQQLPFSGNTRSPQGQVLQGFVDALAGEGYLDEGSHVQVATMIAQGKFALAQKAVNEAVKNKAAAEKMVEQAAKIAEKQIAAEESANASTAPEPVAPSAPAVVAAGRNRRAPNTGAVAGAVQPAAPAAPAVQPGQQSRPADPAGRQPVPALTASPTAGSLALAPTPAAKPAKKTTRQKDLALIDAVENAKDDAAYKAAIDALYKQWMDINQEHPEIEAYLDAEIGTKPTQRAFSKEWDESEARVEDANREGKRGLKVGQSEAGTQSTVDKGTDDILRGLAVPTAPVPAPTKAALAGVALTEPEVSKLEDHYGLDRASSQFWAKLQDDVVALTNRGLKAVDAAIREIIQKLASGVLAVAVVFQPAGLTTDFAFNLPQAYKTTVTEQVKATVPATAKGKMSPLAQSVYESMAPTAKASGKGFVIADKPNGMLHVFRADGSMLVQDTALYGKEIGDTEGKVSSLEGGPKITPAGSFTLVTTADASYAGGVRLDLKETDRDGGIIAIHAAYLGNPKEYRLARLASASPFDKRISYGCVNTSHETFLKYIVPNLYTLNGGMLFVLPDAQAATQAMFPAKTKTTTFEGTEQTAKGEARKGLVAKEADTAPDATPQRQGSRASGKMSLDEVQKLVDRVSRGILGGQSIKVMDVPLGTLPGATVIGKGETAPDGSITIYAAAAENEIDVIRTVFHELFHRGVKGFFKSNRDYIKSMLDLSASDETVRLEAEDWKASDGGIEQRKNFEAAGPLIGDNQANYEALAVEEALAQLGERLRADNKMGSREMRAFVRTAAQWLSKLADRVGLRTLAQAIRRMTYSELENFVSETIDRSGGEVEVGTTARLDGGTDATVYRTGAKAETMHPAVTKATDSVSSFIADAAKEGMVRLAFTKDLVRVAGDHLKAAKEYVALMAERGAVKTRYERKVHTILEMFEALPSAARGTGAGTVNDFIRQSTTSKKWGYEPKHLPGTQADPGMAAKFKALSAAEQAVVKAVFEHGSTTLAAMKAAVTGNMTSDYDLLIAEAKAAGDTTEMASLEKKKIASLKDYTSLMAIGDGTPYAPLKRFGNHVVVGRSQMLVDAMKANDTATVKKLELDGAHYFVEFAETKGEAKKIARENEGKYASVQPFEKDSSTLLGGRDVLGAFYRLRSIAADSDSETNGQASKAVNRMVNDLHLVLLSEQSARHAERTRRNIAGADKDMMRAFATQGRATAQFIASLHNNAQIYEQLLAMKKEADALKPGRGERRMYYNEFMKRHAMGLDYQPSPLADKALAVSSIWLLLTNPAYFLQNATQPLMMSLPAVAGKHGYGRTWGAFTKAYGEVSAALREHGLNEDTYAKLPADVRYAVQKLVDQGSIDITLDQEMGQWKSEADSKMKHFDNAVAKLRKVATDLEAINRVVTGVAAYRLEKQRGATEAVAIEYAGRMIYDTHGDYSGANAPRVMRTPIGRVVTQFRKFQLIQISLMAKLASQAFKGATPEERTAGRWALAYTLSHTLAMGGAMALPGFAAVAWIVGTVWPDDDEPDNPELTLRRAIGNNAVADLLLKGAPKLAGVDLSGKLGMGNMLSVSPYADGGLSREGYNENLVALAGPFLGGLGPKVAHGIGLIYNDKEYYKGLEALLPTGFANAAKAGRLMVAGDTTRKGDTVLSADEISVLEGAMVALGLPTNTLTDKQFLQGAKYQTDTFFKERASRVTKQYTQAYRAGDSAGLADARQDFQDLQEARLRNGYTRQPLSQLLKAPREQAKREANTAGGVQFRKDNRQFVEETSEL